MEKKAYEELMLETIEFKTEDVITASQCGCDFTYETN